MKIICVDDERLINEHVVTLCRELPEVEDAHGFHRSRDALDWLGDHQADVAILDIDVPDMDGIELASRIKERFPQMRIIFLSGFNGSAACKKKDVHGYLTKPVNRERLKAELDVQSVPDLAPAGEKLAVCTFGGLTVFLAGQEVPLPQEARDTLAVLVDKKGLPVSREELCERLWPGEALTRSLKKQAEAGVDALRLALRKAGGEEMLGGKAGAWQVVPQTFSCDAYRFALADIEAVNAYRGGYLRPYAWASLPQSLRRWKEEGEGSPAPQGKSGPRLSWFGRR